MLTIATAQLTCFWLRYYTPLLPPAVPPTYPFILFLSLTLLVAGFMLGIVGAYHLPRRFRFYTISATLLRTMVGHIIITTLAVFLLRLGMQYTKRPFLYSRPVVVAGWIVMPILLLAWRLAFGHLQRALFRLGWGVNRAVVVGTDEHARELAAALQRQHWMGYNVVGLIGPPNGKLPTLPRLGKTADLPDVIKAFKVDVAWLATPEGHLPETISLIFDPTLPVRWAAVQDDYDRLLKSASDSPLPASLSYRDRDDLKTELSRRVAHNLEPLAKPRITFIGSRGIPATYGGIERYVEELGTRLVNRGYRVSVYCRTHYTGRRSAYRGVELRCFPCINTKHLEAISHTLIATLHVLFSKDEIVHYLALGPSLLSWLPRLLGRKTVVTVQGLDWQRCKWGKIARAILRVGEWTSAHLPNRTIVVSNALKQHYENQYGKPAIYIPNGVNKMSRQAPREISKFGLHAGSYVLTVGRLVPEKGYHTLIHAFRLLETDKRLVIVGGTSHTGEYMASLHKMAEGAPVVFTGYAHGRLLDELYSNAYLFVSASEVEGLPITLLEAMSSGICVVTSDIAPHVEALGGLGYTFRVGDEQDLASVLQTLLDRPEMVASAGDKLQQRVAAKYSWHLVTNATERVYRDLLKR
jgi:glycosyltransferase involved in cell wall biosynthesis